MTGTGRCRSCDARNPVGAEWCSQCYEPLAAPVPPAAPPPPAPPAAAPGAQAASATAPAPDGAERPVTPPPPAPRGFDDVDGLLPLPPGRAARAGSAVAPAAPPRPVAAGAGRFRDTEEGLEWRCNTCESWNPIERVTCTVCGVAFMQAGDGDDEPLRDVAPPLLLASTVVLPGAGHALLGLWGQAFSRSVLALVWGVGGLVLLRNALATGQPVLPAVPLLLGWLVLAAASANDVLVAARAVEGRVLLQGRPLLWLVMGVIAGTIGAAFVGALGVVAG